MNIATNRTARLVGVCVVLALVAAVVLFMAETRQKTVTAYFGQTVNLYAGDQVRVLGVKVGTISSVEPLPDQVRVVMHYDHTVNIPASATAAIITPSLVGIRYVQLGPAYESGPALADGGVIPIERTASPAEWDEIKRQLNGLADALAPKAGQTVGALSRLLDTTSANLDGQGPAIRTTIANLSKAMTTLSDGRQDLFGTIRNLQVFVTALRDADSQVARFQTQLAQVSGVLADNSQALGAALTMLDRSAPIIQRFIEDNRGRLLSDMEKLTRVTQNLADNRQGLADVLHRAPGAISNFSNMIDERSGAVTAALAATNARDPAALVCDAAAAVAPGKINDPAAGNACRTGLGPFLQLARADVPPVTVNPITRGGGAPDGPPSPLFVQGGRR